LSADRFGDHVTKPKATRGILTKSSQRPQAGGRALTLRL
jgi:hypothetical protein